MTCIVEIILGFIVWWTGIWGAIHGVYSQDKLVLNIVVWYMVNLGTVDSLTHVTDSFIQRVCSWNEKMLTLCNIISNQLMLYQTKTWFFYYNILEKDIQVNSHIMVIFLC